MRKIRKKSQNDEDKMNHLIWNLKIINNNHNKIGNIKDIIADGVNNLINYLLLNCYWMLCKWQKQVTKYIIVK